jgi:transcriptional regulator with XRE-family HTH domain
MKRLKELREARGLTIRKLADELDVNYSTLHQNEMGDRTNINEALLIKVCDYFNVTPNYLLGYEPTNSFNNSLFLQGCEDEINNLNEEIKALKVENKLLREICLRLSILIQEEKVDEQSS